MSKTIIVDKSNYKLLFDLADMIERGDLPSVGVTLSKIDMPNSFRRLRIEIELFFNRDISKEINWYKAKLRKVGLRELKDGAIEWSPLSRKLRRYIAPLRCYLEKDIFFGTLEQELKDLKIEFMSKEETLNRYGHARMVLIKR